MDVVNGIDDDDWLAGGSDTESADESPHSQQIPCPRPDSNTFLTAARKPELSLTTQPPLRQSPEGAVRPTPIKVSEVSYHPRSRLSLHVPTSYQGYVHFIVKLYYTQFRFEIYGYICCQDAKRLVDDIPPRPSSYGSFHPTASVFKVHHSKSEDPHSQNNPSTSTTHATNGEWQQFLWTDLRADISFSLFLSVKQVLDMFKQFSFVILRLSDNEWFIDLAGEVIVTCSEPISDNL